jgi:hypothetical protein
VEKVDMETIDGVEKYWNKWIKADMIERQNMVEKLPLVRDLIQMIKSGKLEDEFVQRHTALLFVSYLDDLSSVYESKLYKARCKKCRQRD